MRRPDIETQCRIRTAWRKGATARELAEQYGLTPRLVWMICEPRAFGLPPLPVGFAIKRRRPRLPTADRRAEAQRLWLQGSVGRELARLFGVAPSTISADVKGLPTHRRYGHPWEVSWPWPRRRAGSATVDTIPTDRTREVLPSRLGRGARPERVKTTPKQREEMRQLQRSGVSAYQIAKLFSLSANTVRTILREEGRSC